MCCGGDDKVMLGGPQHVASYNDARLKYIELEAIFAHNFSELAPCVSNYDASVPTPDGIKELFRAYEKAFNELLQAQSNVELLHHFATLTKLIDGLRMVAQIAFGAQYQMYQSTEPAFLSAPPAAKDGAARVRNALNISKPL